MKNAIMYDVISPDGFSFGFNDLFESKEQAIEKFETDYKKRYEQQGYYSSVRYGRIPLDDLHRYCRIKEVDTSYTEE